MNHRFFVVMLALCLMTATGVLAQIKFVVQDDNGSPLLAVNTFLLNYNGVASDFGAAGDLDGSVLYDKVVPGEYHLVIRHIGYQNDTVKNLFITGSGQLVDLGVIRLQQLDNILDEVVITAQRPTLVRDGNKLTLNIKGTTLETGENAQSIMSYLPGVMLGQNGILVNGKDNVLVKIDGRRQYATGDDLTNLLQSLSSEAIESIEKDRASAKDDATGGGAVINITMKRSYRTGVYGSIWTRYRQDKNPSAYAGNNLNWKYKKFSGNFYYYFSFYQGFHDIDISRTVDDLGPGDTPLYFNETLDEMWTFVSHAPRAKLFYDVNDNHRIGLQAELSHLNIDFPKEATSMISDDGKEADSSVISTISTNNLRILPSANLSYHGVVAQNTGTVDLTYDYFFNTYDLTSHFHNQKQDENMIPTDAASIFREFSDLTNSVHTAAFDFSKQLKRDHYLDIGVKATSINKVTNTRIERMTGDVYYLDPASTKSFAYREDIYAGYINWLMDLPKNWSIETGLRIEHTRIQQMVESPASTSRTNYVDYFPFASFYKEAENGNAISMAYSRRTLRPTFDQLNPFVLELNPFLVVSGDADLKPQINNVVDLEYSFKKDYAIYASYNMANRSINSVFLDEGGGRYNLTYKNFRRSHFANVGLSMTLSPYEWWSISTDVNVAYDVYNVKLEGEEITRKGAAVSVNVTNEFELPRGFYLELLGIYESPRYTSIEYYKSTGRVDLTLTKYFMDDNLSLKLRGRDLFYTTKSESSLDYLNLHSNYLERSGSRRIEFTLTYKYQRGESFKARRNKKSNTEEKDRT